MHKFVVICLCVMIFLCGCEGEEIQPTPNSSFGVKHKDKVQSKDTQKIVKQLNKISKTGELVTIVQNQNSLFCVQKNNENDIVYCLDLESDNLIKSALPYSMGGKVEIQCTGEYIVLYDKNQKVVIMDSHLDILNDFTIKEKIIDGLRRNYCVLPNAEKIVYTKEILKNKEWYQEVNECDYSGKNKRQICKIEDVTKNVGKVNEITQLVVAEDEKTLFFFGSYFKTASENETSIPCFGQINRIEGDVISVQEEKEQGQLCGNTMMFVDGLCEKGTTPSGYITCLDEQGNQEKYSFRRKEESQEVIISNEGTYYLSYVRKEDETSDVTCYSFNKSAYQWKKKLTHYVFDLWYFEQEKLLLYSYYTDNGKLCFQGEVIH